ncbi:MAG: adenylyl-sulfate kinase [Polyangiales bacterium]
MQKPKSANITWQTGGITRVDREQVRGHRGATLWFTGLSGSGKSTLAAAIERRLLTRGCATYLLDGDNVRHGLNRDLGFAPEDRSENNRRIGEVAKLFTDASVLCLCAFISPYREDRARIRAAMAPGDFIEIYVRASLDVCEERDPKGLYKKARAGQIPDMTGIGAPYEVPESPELVLDTEARVVDRNVDDAVRYLEQRGYILDQS